MQAKAIARGLPSSARKIRLIVDQIRGKRVEEALTLLRFMPQPSAKDVAKVVKSAAANAENKSQYTLDAADLKIVTAYADEGLTMKRFKARSRGRTSPILRRSSHVTIIVADQEG